MIRIMEMEDELNRQIDELVDKKQEIAEVISRIEDVSVRVILKKRLGIPPVGPDRFGYGLQHPLDAREA